ncbi:MAG TPA: tyrosine--tRNA ligase [Gemmatimonadales bacterium]|jgi:tyrosyl-tRNA synthetase|nr:tyrosine--tRNA ligase [Gemmatimonadales bacterium]
MPSLLAVLTERGLIHDATPGLAQRLGAGPITGYVGFDPTADSLHVGSLLPVMLLAWLQRLGGRPIALVGGGTGLVGDPSGKRGERPMLAEAEIAANAAAIRSQLARFVSFEGGNAARLLDNAEWLRPLDLLDFLRDVGKHFTVNYMLQKESVKARLESGISFTEFAYMLVQAYDFLHLFHTERCELQMGGSDQWGNITAGIELIARRERAVAHGLVCPLLTTAPGAKFGKSEDGNVWLDPAKTTPYRFYQFWLNSDDRDVERLLRLFTFRPLEDIAAAMARQAADPGRRPAQRILAEDLTVRVHGAATTRRVIEASGILFGEVELRDADADTLAIVAGEVPVVPLDRARLDAGVPLVDALVGAGLASSKADARRGLQGNGFSVNGEKLAAERALGARDLLAGRYIVLQKGRKHFALMEVR